MHRTIFAKKKKKKEEEEKKKSLPTGTERLDGQVLFSFSIALLIVLAGVFLLLAARLRHFPLKRRESR